MNTKTLNQTLKNIWARIKYNPRRLITMITATSILVAGIVYLALISVDRTEDLPYLGVNPTPTPYQTLRDVGFKNPDTTQVPKELIFEDPLKVPNSITTYKILPAPEELFSNESIVSMARDIGFTGNASVQPTGNGYTYFESNRRLTVQPTIGMINYSLSYDTLNDETVVINNIENAIGEARKFVEKINFSNPIYLWGNNPVVIYEIVDGVPQRSPTFVPNGFIEVEIPLHVAGLSIVYPQKLYVRVHLNGQIVGANLWYPYLDINNPETKTIVDFVEAVDRANAGQGVYFNGETAVIPGDQTFTFEKSNIVFFVSNLYLNGLNDTYYLNPMYQFMTNNVQMYISALP